MTDDIQIYSLAKDGAKKLSPHFQVWEFKCHDGSDLIKVSPETVRLLECIRSYYGDRPLTVRSGYRTPSHNRRVGGATRSRHIVGDAADFYIGVNNRPLVDPPTVYADINAGRVPGVDPKKIGLGRYPSFTHIDSRGTRARWKR